MSTLSDFFGSSEDQPECSFCGGTNGKLIVSISDNYGPTHWHHESCRQEFDAQQQEKARKVQEQAHRNEMHERYQD